MCRGAGFQPDKAGLNQLIDFPAAYGIIKGPDGNITLNDSGWDYDPYIYQRNNSCCGKHAFDQFKSMGFDPGKVTKIVVGHGHWDHAGQLRAFPQATLYIQKEELKQIDFFLDYPTQYNFGRIRAVNTVDPLTCVRVGPPAQACAPMKETTSQNPSSILPFIKTRVNGIAGSAFLLTPLARLCISGQSAGSDLLFSGKTPFGRTRTVFDHWIFSSDDCFEFRASSFGFPSEYLAWSKNIFLWQHGITKLNCSSWRV